MTKQINQYSTLFSCIYDEQEPVGHLGRGTHYSVFRSVEWLDVTRTPINRPQIHDFSVIWDEDHDTRVIDVIESIYMAGLLSPIQFIGERKGMLTIIVAAKFYFSENTDIRDYVKQLQDTCDNSPLQDHWPVGVGMFDRSPHFPPSNPHQTELCGIINDANHSVVTYLRNIDSLWRLGTKAYTPKVHIANLPIPPVPVPIQQQ
ncbi:hypothetical protein M2404_001999 [Rheinheimera pacifica]|uniref:hypothetical protein n=1 Tax=Rheinheimera pacifica TaxID=173990 RepID=UPI002168E9AB|nr:hypothetical protein [Rheinheimera pacifica]MCS4307659.1 hypothetical protein [Rheinheimera pacifica]